MAQVAAIGLKARSKNLATMGLEPIVRMVGGAAYLAALTWAMLHLGSVPGPRRVRRYQFSAGRD